MKIAYCGYDFFASSLQSLVLAGHELVELFTFATDNQYDFNEKVFSIAGKSKARITLSPISIVDLHRLSSEGVDVLISAAYPFKVPLWSEYLKYAINVHPSPLPEGRGVWPLPHLILKSFTKSAVTIHEISEMWDAGDIIAQRSFDLSDYETLEMLSVRSQIHARELILDTVGNLEQRWKAKRPQGIGTYWAMPTKHDRTIRWDMPVDEIDRVIRAFSKFEPFLYIDNVRFFVRKADVWKTDHAYVVGELVHETNREKVYAAQDGLVCLTHFEKAEA